MDSLYIHLFIYRDGTHEMDRKSQWEILSLLSHHVYIHTTSPLTLASPTTQLPIRALPTRRTAPQHRVITAKSVDTTHLISSHLVSHIISYHIISRYVSRKYTLADVPFLTSPVTNSTQSHHTTRYTPSAAVLLA